MAAGIRTSTTTDWLPNAGEVVHIEPGVFPVLVIAELTHLLSPFADRAKAPMRPTDVINTLNSFRPSGPWVRASTPD
jgi:hypothetical protein